MIAGPLHQEHSAHQLQQPEEAVHGEHASRDMGHDRHGVPPT